MFQFIYYFSLFMIYSFGGWVIEMIFVGFQEKKIVNRGFLLGPYLPIYGIASILMTFLLDPFKQYPVLLFISAILICSIIEYFTGYAMEKIFNAKWWDYSNEPFNLHGRICLRNAFLFGILGTALIYLINPCLFFCLDLVPIPFLYFVAGLLLSLFTIDFVLSFHVIRRLKLTAAALKKDYSDEMSHKVREALSKEWSFKRILNAFPDFTFINFGEFKKILKIKAKYMKDRSKRLVKKNRIRNVNKKR